MAQANKDSAARERLVRQAPSEREVGQRRGGAGAPSEAPHWSDFAADPRGGTRKRRRSPERGPGVADPALATGGDPEVPWKCHQRSGQRGGTGKRHRDGWADSGQGQHSTARH